MRTTVEAATHRLWVSLANSSAPVLAAALVFATVGTISPAGAEPEAGQRQVVTATVADPTAGSPMALTLGATYSDGGTPPGAPYALRHVNDHLPSGTTVNPSATPICRATELVLMLLGPAACPQSTVGSGFLIVSFGLNVRLRLRVTLLNAGDELLFLGQEPTTGVGLIGHGKIVGTTISLDVPQLPGLGHGGAVVEQEEFTITAASGYLTSPETCPASGAWTLGRDQTYSDGATQSSSVAIPCRG